MVLVLDYVGTTTSTSIISSNGSALAKRRRMNVVGRTMGERQEVLKRS
jgi:hypothetical protein